MRSKNKRSKVPVTEYELETGVTMKPAYCFNPECKAFICYEAIITGIIHHQCHHCKTITQVSMLPGDNDEPPEHMQEVRCGQCGRFLYKEALIKGSVKTKCRGCKRWNTLVIEDNTAKVLG